MRLGILCTVLGHGRQHRFGMTLEDRQLENKSRVKHHIGILLIRIYPFLLTSDDTVIAGYRLTRRVVTVTEVTDNTQTIILEAANFNGANIRRTARSCGLATEASGRFERGIDIEGTINALNRACELLQKMNKLEKKILNLEIKVTKLQVLLAN